MLSIEIQVLMAQQAGLVRFDQLRVRGLQAKQLKQALRSGALVRVRPAVYTSGEGWEAAHVGAPRELLRARAASLVMPGAHALSHDSAAHALGLPFLMEQHPWVHITRRGVHGDRHLKDVKQHLADHRDDQVVAVSDLAVLDTARTAVDLARQHGLRCGLGACDAALRRGVRRADLAAVIEPMRSWPGVNSARDAAGWCDAGAENPGESLARLAVLGTGLGWPKTQVPVQLADQVAWCDLLLGPQAIEFDGRAKYRPIADGGLAEDPGQVVWRERQRERGLLAAGLGVSRIVWEELLPHRWAATVARLAQEINATMARVGPHPPVEVRAFAERYEPERQRRLFGRPRVA